MPGAMADEEVTFRDFAGALMSGDQPGAARVLSLLLGLDSATATTAAERFRQGLADDPVFMQRAMGMRQVVEARDEPALSRLIEECFGLERDDAARSAATVLARYR
jgi:hypothetical protein